jgi:hypothetical protein
MKKMLLLAVCLALVGCGPMRVVLAEPTPTQVPCTRALYVEMLGTVIDRWDDANALANNTPRSSLAPQIAALQSINREAEALNVPACAMPTHQHLLDYMSRTVDGYMAFLSQGSDFTVRAYFRQAIEALDLWTAGLAQLPTE